MKVNVKVLCKGVEERTGKDGRKYYNVHFYATEGKPLDLVASVDVANGGLGLFEAARSLQAKMTDASFEITTWEGKVRFGLLDVRASQMDDFVGKGKSIKAA